MPASSLTVTPEIFARFPGMRIVVAVASGLDNRTPRPAVAAFWREAWERAGHLAGVYANAQSHPRVQPWRAAMRAMGVSGKEFPCSIEAILRRAMKGGEPFAINPLVDFYNAVSLRHTVPAGAYDLADMTHPLELRATREGDRFTALDDPTPIPVHPGEIAYTDGPIVLTRHFVWRQSREALITPETTAALLLSEILGEVGDAAAGEVLVDFTSGLAAYFGVTPVTFVLDAENPVAAW